MSTTTALGVIPNRRPVELKEFYNSSGWAPSIWRRLLIARGGDGNWMTNWGDGISPALRSLWQAIDTMPSWQQVPLVLTFDTGVIPFSDYGWAAKQLDEFDRRLPAPEGHANHVPGMAELLRSGPEAPYFAVYGTSVSSNPFDPFDAEAEVYVGGIPLSEMYLLPRHRSGGGR